MEILESSVYSSHLIKLGSVINIIIDDNLITDVVHDVIIYVRIR